MSQKTIYLGMLGLDVAPKKCLTCYNGTGPDKGNGCQKNVMLSFDFFICAFLIFKSFILFLFYLFFSHLIDIEQYGCSVKTEVPFTHINPAPSLKFLRIENKLKKNKRNCFLTSSDGKRETQHDSGPRKLLPGTPVCSVTSFYSMSSNGTGHVISLSAMFALPVPVN